MAKVLPTYSHISIDMTREDGTTAPLPNPPFVFPIQSEEVSDPSLHARTSSNADRASPRRSAARNVPQQLSLNRLPAFDFSPAASGTYDLPPSPSRSPSRRTPPAYHSTGHRRNGSEYVGGGLTNGGPLLVSSSPTKSEHSSVSQRDESDLIGADAVSSGTVLSTTDPVDTEGPSYSQPNTRLGPPPVKRGHAHRRSGAISSHDLTMILKPLTETKAGSAPTTPSDPIFQVKPVPELDRSTSQPALNSNTGDTLPPPKPQDSSSTDGQPRPRARFSEKIDYIPRPLSTISSETSSSISTIRANHSVTNSISSVVGACMSESPPNNYQTPRRGQTVLALELDRSRNRPRTAGPLSRPSSGDWEWYSADSATAAKRPSSAPSSDSPPKSLEPVDCIATHEDLNSVKQFHNNSRSKSAQTVQSSPRSTNAHFSRRRPISPTMRPRTSPEPKVTKRQRKGRSWAGLLSRKGKQHEFKEDLVRHRSPTPPLRQPSPEFEFSLDDINFDEDTTHIIETGSPYSTRFPKLQTDYATWKPRESSPLSESDNSASMLDIDAALGSFDTTGTGPSFGDVVGEGSASATKRPMHSSGATGGFAGPGMHYHRRTESAPEMDAFDHPKFGFPRLGSNPAMAIEEEEEDEEQDLRGISEQGDALTRASQAETKENEALGLGVNLVEADNIVDQPMQRAFRQPNINTNFRQEQLEELGPVEIVEADEEPRFSVITKSSDESTITPSLSRDCLDTYPASAPADHTAPTPTLAYEIRETPSTTSSPDFTRTSFDGPRMHTATSSITDRTTLSSSRAGDHALGLHGSIDDVPSLTSSASTTSAHPTRFSSSANSAADRSSSLSAAAPARVRPVSAHKRLSLASLSRLAGSSYNKSKLNIEETAPPVDNAECVARKKGNRISRMMKFWKSKEKLSS